MRSFSVLFLAAALAWPLLPADKPTPRQKAKELLDSAAAMVAATKPDVQVAALQHLAENFQAFDRKKATEYLRQAFTAAGNPAIDSPFARGAQGDIAVSAAALDPALAIEMLKQMQAPSQGYDYRGFAAGRVITVMLQKDQLDAAITLTQVMGAAGAYPFFGASQILAKLPVAEPQWLAVFSAALEAYVLKPDRTFHNILMRYRKDLPPGMAAAALEKILSAILEKKDEQSYRAETLSSAKGTVTFAERVEAELFDVMPLVREIDPKRYDDLIGKYSGLKSAMQLFPGGGPSVADDRGVTIYTVGSNGKPSDPAAEKRAADAMNEQAKLTALINSRAESALQAATKDPDKALDMVENIPSPPKQAEVLGRIAESVSETDPAKAKHVLGRCVALLDAVKYPGDRIVPWDLVASAAGAAKDDQLVETAIDKLLGDAAELYKDDGNADRPNRAWREYWPSTQAYRRAVIRSVKLRGVDAEPILQKIADADQNVLARITMAQALLGKSFGDFRTFGGRTRPVQTGK